MSESVNEPIPLVELFASDQQEAQAAASGSPRPVFGLPFAHERTTPAPSAETPTPPAASTGEMPTVGLAPVPPPAAPLVARVAAPAAPVQPEAPSALRTPSAEPGRRLVLDDLLIYVLENGGSDLHITAGAVPTIRKRGEMHLIPGYAPLTPAQLQTALFGVMTERQRKTFEEDFELDFAYSVPGNARFRVNLFRQRGSIGAVMRLIPWDIRSLESLDMPTVIDDFAAMQRGLVLVTGPTGSGKSTTLAAIIDRINRTRSGHIITIEDPVEFLHEHRGCLVNQREVGQDTHNFRSALKHALRQDPDVILVGELRDLDTISVALTAAETGHLVLATLHTQSAQATITRIVDVFPADQQDQIRTQLAATLQAVVCQSLIQTADGSGRVAAVEIMVCNPGIRAMIRDGKLQQIQGALQAGAKDGMQTLNAHLATLVKSNRISYDAGLESCTNKEDFDTLVSSTTQQRLGSKGWG